MVFWRMLAGVGAFLSMVDAFATYVELQLIPSAEANPIMAWAYSAGLPVFFGIKFVSVLLFYFLTQKEQHPLAKVGIATGVAAYFSVCVLHAILAVRF